MHSTFPTVVSIIVPSYHSDKDCLERCLTSIVSQKGHDLALDCIVVFDGSPEKDIINLARKFVDVKTIEIEHSGVSSARNEGIAQASGKYLTFVDADDELPENALSDLVAYAEQYSCDVVQGAYDAVLPFSIEHHSYKTKNEVFRGDSLKCFQRDVLCPDKGLGLAWGKLFRRSFILENEIAFDDEMAVSEDTAFALDACSRARVIGYIPSVVYRYMRNDSSTVSSYRPDYVDRIINSIKHMKNHIEAISDNAVYRDNFSSYILFHLLLVQLHYLFNPSAPWSRKERRKKYEETLDCEIFRLALDSSDYNDFPLAKRISLVALKLRAYQCSRFISFVRRIQLSR